LVDPPFSDFVPSRAVDFEAAPGFPEGPTALSFFGSLAFGWLDAFAGEGVLGAEGPGFFGFSCVAPDGGAAASAGAAVTLGARRPRLRRVAQTTAEQGLGRRILDFVTVESELVKS
jgi:hypothetical protein